MADNRSPANGNQDESDRQRRLAALQRLAQRDPAPEPASPKAQAEHALPELTERGRLRGRRWIIPLVVGALLVALAAVAIFQFAPGLRDGASTARTSALNAQVMRFPRARSSIARPCQPGLRMGSTSPAWRGRSSLEGRAPVTRIVIW